MSVILIGYRGSGKSTTGKKLAQKLWQKFVDTDDLIIARSGRSIREIFETDGEAAFRELEQQVVKEAMGLQDHVIALGGGAVLAEANRQAIRESGHRVIYLRCDPDVLSQRIAGDAASQANRPALTPTGSSTDEVKQVLAVREPIYRQVRHAELDVTHLSPDDAVVYIVRLM
ncbi:MAG: shikimate kinase [Phycisphaerales bacterium]|nr:shikimate kinase [Phycisphaerales bacterium]